MFEVTVYEQSFSSVAGAKSLLNSLLRSNPYLSTPLGLTPEDAAAGPPGESAGGSGVSNATATPAAATFRLLRRGRRVPTPQRGLSSRSGGCLSNPMCIPQPAPTIPLRWNRRDHPGCGNITCD